MSENQDENHQVYAVDDSSLHKCRTELPNIIMELDLDPYEFRLYCHIKKIAGDKGSCWMSVDNLAKACQMSKRKVQSTKKKLSRKRPELNNLPLINIFKRKKDLGDNETDLIQIIDIWPINFQKIYGGGAQHAPGGVHNMHPGGAQHAPKEDLLEEDPLEEVVTSQLAKASRRPAIFLFEKILEINPKAKPPNFNQWAKDIEKLIRIDGRTEEEIIKVIEWTFNDNFWCKNILSGRKLREKFDQLWMNMHMHKECPKKKEADESKKKADRCKANILWAKEFLKDKTFYDHQNCLTLKDNGVVAIYAGDYRIIGFLEHGFQDQLTGIYKKIAS